MDKTLEIMNRYWTGKKVAIAVSDIPGDYEIGKLDHFEWVIPENYSETQMPQIKAVFTEKEKSANQNLEVIFDVATFAIKEYEY